MSNTGKKSFVCSVCHCKHQSARGQQCAQIKQNLPIFTTFVRCHDGSDQTSFAKNTDETLESVYAIRRIMAFVHSNTDAYKAWSTANPTAEIGLESSVVPVRPQTQPAARAPTSPSSSSSSSSSTSVPVRPSVSSISVPVRPLISIPALTTTGITTTGITFLPEPKESFGSLGNLGNDFEPPSPPRKVRTVPPASSASPAVPDSPTVPPASPAVPPASPEVPAAAPATSSTAAAAAAAGLMFLASSGDKGPAPPSLAYGFLSKEPKITSLTLKKD